MKRTLLLIITILSAIPMLAGDNVNIIITKTGTLDSLLKKHTAISSLTIRGTLNKADLASIKRFVAYKVFFRRKCQRKNKVRRERRKK